MHYIERRKITCTGGMSTLVLKPNGSIYRCAMQCDSGAPPLCHIEDNELALYERPEPCSFEQCTANCDITDTQKFIYERSLSGEEVCAGTYVSHTGLEPAARNNFLSYHQPGKQKKKIGKISWYPSIRCNFNCFYCDSGDSRKVAAGLIRASTPELTGPQWLKGMKRLYDHFDWAVVFIVGGEPTLLDYLLPAIKMLSSKFHCLLFSNLSQGVFELSRSGIQPASPAFPYPLGDLPVGLSVNASLHPLAKAFHAERFKASALLLRHNGYPVSVSMPGHPLQLFLAEDWAAWCARHSLPFYLQSWKGEDHAGHIARYSAAERDYVARYELFEALCEDDQRPLPAPSGQPPWHAKQPGLSAAQMELLGPYPRYLSGHLTMKLWDYELSRLPPQIQISSGTSLSLAGRVRNLSDEAFAPDKGFKVGARLYKGSGPAALLEGRAEFASPLQPEEERDFSLHLDCSGLAAGVYRLAVDVVREGAFWLTQKGARGGRPYDLDVSIHEQGVS